MAKRKEVFHPRNCHKFTCPVVIVYVGKKGYASATSFLLSSPSTLPLDVGCRALAVRRTPEGVLTASCRESRECRHTGR